MTKQDTPRPTIEFEKLYRDRISGFEGYCVGKSSFVSGCDQVMLTAKVTGDGKPAESVWLDDDRLIDVEADAAVQRTSRKGGPQHGPMPR